MKYADMFARVKGMFMQADVSDITEHLAYQFNITGEAEGIFYVEVKEGKLYVEPYEYFDRDEKFNLKQYLTKSFGVFQEKPIKVKLLFSKNVKDADVSDDYSNLTYGQDCYTPDRSNVKADGSIDTEINSKHESVDYGELFY